MFANDARSRIPPDARRENLTEHMQRVWDVWMLGESLAPRDVVRSKLDANTIQRRRVWLCKRRAKARALLPIRVDGSDLAAVRALGPDFARVANILEQVDADLAALRKPKAGPPAVESVTNTHDLRKLRARLRVCERKLNEAGGRYSAQPAAQEWLQLVRTVTEHLHNCEQDLYEQRCREWEYDHKQDPVRFRKRPQRPTWLRQAEEREDAAATEARRCHINVVPLPTQTWHEKEVDRVHAVLERRARVKQARKRSHLEALQCKLLDWAWGVGRCSGLDVDLQPDMGAVGSGVWLYFDRNDVPYESLRQHVLASCAVRCTTGWAFPPETARGRVVVAGLRQGV
ncbi:MAG: hypothetical protein WC359_13755 [Dehalococcoidia bacterium]|jgi:hypothetical protein